MNCIGSPTGARAGNDMSYTIVKYYNYIMLYYTVSLYDACGRPTRAGGARAAMRHCIINCINSMYNCRIIV